MNKTIYRQYDSRWSKLPYPYGNSTLYGCGCGCLAVLHCLLEISKYKKYTPINIQPYMKQFAVYGQGTTWAGITTALKHYGFESVINHANMSSLWKELNKGDRVGVILFGSKRGPDGTVWTTGGHFIAYTGYKVKNGKHYLYLKDSGTRKHDGWFCYETSMQGDVVQVWSAKIPEAEKTKPKAYSGNFPNIKVITGKKKVDNGQKIADKAKAYAWPKGTATKKWVYKTGAPRKVYATALKKYRGKNTRLTRSNCDYFVDTCVRAAGVDSTFCSLKWSKKLKSCWKVVQKGKKVDVSKLQPGDIIRYKKKSGQHVLMYYKKGYIAEAGRGLRFPIIRKDSHKYNKSDVRHSTLQVIRAKNTVQKTYRNYLMSGDKGDEVVRLQKFFNWLYGEGTLAIDGEYGANTKAVVQKFQKSQGLKATGKFGKKTLAAAKAIKK